MTRRLTLAILGTVAATLVLAGVGTLFLARFEAREQSEREVREQADAVAGVLSFAGEAVQGLEVPIRVQLETVTRRLRVEDVEVVVILPSGQLDPSFDTDLPEGIEAEDLEPERLRAGSTVSDSRGSLVYAVAPVNPLVGPGGGGTDAPVALVAVVVAREAEQLVAPAFRWFLIAAGATLALGVLVAWQLGRRLTRPLIHATEATRRIAGGDLDTRVPEVTGRDDELAELARSINSMTEALQRSRGLERNFLLSVSHDLRTPLTSIRGYAEAVADGTSTDTAGAAGVILAEAGRLERLVRDLLDLARLDASRFSLDLQRTDVTAIVTATAESFRPEAEDAGLVLDVRDPGSVFVLADPDRLSQVVANLVENALKYAIDEVGVTVEDAPGGPRVVVSDDGVGIAPEDQPHVFDRLYVASRAPRRKDPGSGLGLAIVRELVAAMGGTVTAESVEAAGTRMIVTLRPVD